MCAKDSEIANGNPYLEDIHWLQANTLDRVVTASIAVGVAWYAYCVWVLDILDRRLWLGPACLAVSSLLAWWSTRRCGTVVGAWASVISVALSLSLAAWAFADPWLLLFLALPVGMASLLLGFGAGFGAAVATTLALVAVTLFWPAVPARVAWFTAILSSLVALLLWVAMYPLRTAMGWAWTSYERSRQQTAALMEQRGRLNQTVKDLNAAYARLDAMARELEHARQAADEGRRLKAQFAANISHELRTPLNLIIGFSEMMALNPHVYDQPLPPSYRSDVQSIYHNAQHLASLIDDVLDLSQVEAGRMGLAEELTSLARVASEAASAVSNLFESKGLTLTMDVPGDLPVVAVDRTRIRQVLINLLGNAARFTERGGVTVTATANEKEITVSVADTGIGIAEEDIPKAFEEFRQLDGTIRRRSGGSGLGLAISKKFVELHGGRMWVRSQVGKGTTFYFTLPRRADAASRPLPPEWETWARTTPNTPEHRSLVIVDRQRIVTRLLQRHLDGYRAFPVETLNQARQHMAEGRVDALLVVASDGEDPPELADACLEDLPDVPVAICTPRNGAKARVAGVVGHLVKPISQDRLLHALAALDGEVRSVLIVDDDPEVVRLLSRMLRLAPRPLAVMKAFNGQEALDLMRKRRPGAVLLDILMPVMDGYAVCRHMKADERLRNVPVILISAQDPGEEVLATAQVRFTQRRGLTSGETIRCLKAGLDALTLPSPPGTRPTGPAASAG